MNKIYYDKLNYTFFTDVMDNGLKVLYLKKPGFHKFSCYFGCNLGGKVNKYSYDGKIYDIPLGVAHFLEHQMFEMPDGVNASDYLSMYGLENNAYTSFDRTMYLVNGIENFDIAINYLLDFVQTPYFINKNIDVEREIIIQELNMYSDMPVVKIKNLVKKNLYGNISYSSDVGGSVEEVRKIDEDILNQVYNHFYTPKNMCVGIIGSYDEEYVFDLIRKNQAKKTFNYNDLPIVLLDKGLNNQIKHNDEIKLDINDDCVYYALKINDELLSSKDYNSYTACMKLELLM